MSKHVRNTLLFSILHLIIGNIIGIYVDDPGVLQLLFFPYAIISQIGFDPDTILLVVFLEVIGFIIMTSIFIPLALFFLKRPKN